MSERLRIYLSSTLSDLHEYRFEAIEAIRSVGADPIVVDDVVASPTSAAEQSIDLVRNSDLVVVVVGHRYGVVPVGHRVGYVELEYRAALECDSPVLAFFIEEEYPWPLRLRDTGEALARLERFKLSIRERMLPESFTTPSDLAMKIARAIRRFSEDAGIHISEQCAARNEESEESLQIRLEAHIQSIRTDLSDLRVQLSGAMGRERADNELRTLTPPLFLGPMADSVDPDLCFIAMPYSKPWSESVRDTLDGICTEEGFRPLIANEMSGRLVVQDIWKGITSAGVVIADITDGNPNVAYELGLADLLGRDVILLSQQERVPFDFQGHRLIGYEDSMRGSISLKEELAARLRSIKASRCPSEERASPQ